MNLFNELKRRNVFRVGVAYLIGAWLLLQIADVVLNNIAAPDWVFKAIMLLVSIGLPVALFFAWAFELTPDGVKRESEVDRSLSNRLRSGQKLDRGIIVILVIALAYFVWESRFSEQGSEPFSQEVVVQTTKVGDEKNDPTPANSGVAEIHSVAVLPFVNMSSDPEQEYFSDGITEEIINALVKIPGLSVPARTSVFGFKGQQGDVRKIGEQLNVAHILEGSIRSQGNQVRITAQLINVDDGFHLWSETYDRKLDNIFVVQEEIATAIAQVLTGELGLDVVTVPNQTHSMEAYDSYLQGRALLHKRGEENLDQAVAFFKRATTLDPDFAPAWAAMALTYSVMHLSYERLALAIRTARHALSLDPDNVDALDALASALRDSWRWAEAESYFDEAMKIDPQSSELLEDYAEFLGSVGRLDDYLAVAERGYSIDPQLAPLADSYVWALMAHGQFTRAIEVIDEWNASAGSEKTPTYWQPTYWKLVPLLASGNTDEAVAMIGALSANHMAEPIKTAIIALLKNPADEKARSILRSEVSKPNASVFETDGYMSGIVLIYTGDIDYAIDRLIVDSQQYSGGNIEDIWSPIFASFRLHPRFAEYLEILNLPKYWDKTGWPDICQRNANGGIECQ